MSHETESVKGVGLWLTPEELKKLKAILKHEKVDKLIDYQSTKKEDK